ncbi:MAG: ABC transporter substrate-binding protein [Opitutaceae bacterium]
MLTPLRLQSLFAHFAALLATLGALTVTGCRHERSDDGRVRIVYWEKWTGAEAVAMQEVVDRFNVSQDRIFVEYLAVSQIDRKTIVATAGGDPPDVAGIWLAQVATFADNSALTPMGRFIEADGMTVEGFLSRYEPIYADMCLNAGHVYALPSTPATLALHWNKTLFREAGLDPERPPRTLAELDDYARRLTKRDPQTGDITQLGFLPQEPGWWPWAFFPWFGGSLFDENGEVSLGTDPVNLQAMEWVRGYTVEYGLDDIRRFTSGFGSFASPQFGFFSRRVAMVFQGVWFDNYMSQFAPGLDYGVAPWPEAGGGAPGAPFAVADADMLVIPRGTRHPREAWEFVKYVNSENPAAESKDELGGMELLCLLQAKNSPLRLWSPYFLRAHPHPYIEVFRELAQSPRVTHIPLVGVWQEYFREIQTVFDRIRLLDVEPAAGLAYAHARIARSWDRHRTSLERQRRAAARAGAVDDPTQPDMLESTSTGEHP